MNDRTKILVILLFAALALCAGFYFRSGPAPNSILEFITADNLLPGASTDRETSGSSYEKDFKYSRRIRFSIVSYSLPEKLYAKGKIIQKYLEENLGIEVKMIILRNYDSLIDLLKTGQIEAVWAAPLIYRNIKNEINYNLLLKLLERNSPFYEGAVIVRTDSGIKDLKQLEGKTMAFVDENSASGFYLQNRLINDMGASSLKFFSKFEFVGSHDRALQLVYDKKFDAAAVGIQLMNFAPGMNSKEINIIAQTPRIPNAPILVNNNLDAGIRGRIRELLLHPEKFKGGTEFIKQLSAFDGFTGFTTADTSEYEF